MPLDIDIKVDNEAGKMILDNVTLKSFTATPAKISPFEPAVLKWEVEGPEEATVLLNNKQVPANGSKTVEVVSTATFVLSAKALTASKALGQRTISVDLEGCSEFGISKGVLENQVQEEIHDRIPAEGKVRLRGVAVIDYKRANLNINIPLRVEVPNFFDADATITMEYRFTNTFGNKTKVQLGDVEVDIDLGTGAKILGTLEAIKGGSTIFAVEQVVESVLKDVIKEFVGKQLRDELENAIEDQIRDICEFTNKRVRSIFYNDSGILITCCPDITENGGTERVADEVVAFMPVDLGQ